MLARGERGEIGEHLLPGDHASRHRLHDVAGVAERRFVLVDENAGIGDDRVVALAHVLLVAADEVDMGAGLQPAAMHDGLGRARRRADHVGLEGRHLAVDGGNDLDGRSKALADRRRRRFGAGKGPAADHDAAIAAHAGMGGDHVRRQRAGGEERERRGIGPRQIVGRQGGCGGCAHVGEAGGFDDRAQLARHRIEHVEHFRAGAQPASGIGGHRAHQLHDPAHASLPGRHHEQAGPVAAVDLVANARRHHRALPEPVAKRPDQGGKINERLDTLAADQLDGHDTGS